MKNCSPRRHVLICPLSAAVSSLRRGGHDVVHRAVSGRKGGRHRARDGVARHPPPRLLHQTPAHVELGLWSAGIRGPPVGGAGGGREEVAAVQPGGRGGPPSRRSALRPGAALRGSGLTRGAAPRVLRVVGPRLARQGAPHCPARRRAGQGTRDTRASRCRAARRPAVLAARPRRGGRSASLRSASALPCRPQKARARRTARGARRLRVASTRGAARLACFSRRGRRPGGEIGTLAAAAAVADPVSWSRVTGLAPPPAAGLGWRRRQSAAAPPPLLLPPPGLSGVAARPPPHVRQGHMLRQAPSRILGSRPFAGAAPERAIASGSDSAHHVLGPPPRGEKKPPAARCPVLDHLLHGAVAIRPEAAATPRFRIDHDLTRFSQLEFPPTLSRSSGAPCGTLPGRARARGGVVELGEAFSSRAAPGASAVMRLLRPPARSLRAPGGLRQAAMRSEAACMARGPNESVPTRLNPSALPSRG